MEDKTPPSKNASPPAARTAESLRELHERARAALNAQRERMGRLEAQLSRQLDSIASVLAEQGAAPTDRSQPAAQSVAEANRLQQELAAAKAAWQAEREQFAAETARRQQLLDQRQAELDKHAEQLAADRAEIDSRQQALDERAAQLNAQEREVRNRHEALNGREQQLTAGQEESAEAKRQLDHQRGELAARDKSWEVERAALAAEHDDLAGKITQLTEEAARLRDESARQLADAERKLEEQQAAWDDARTALENERLAVEKKRDELAESVASANEELQAVRLEAEAAGELPELQQKFGLALEDVQRLRRRVAELEQELDARPAPDQSDTVELVHLRSERDALAERVTELEQQSAPPVDADAAQEMADLQRRFELAVEDVRDLKKTNSRLEAQLAEAQSRTAASAPAPAGGSSWEFLKQQMLASLEGESGDGDQERREERATIESTIRITDDVVADKDREIADLKSRLAEGGGRESAEDEAVRELIDADAVIQQHRKQIEKLESETQEKLRAAELEMSVERAKIAREQAHLAEVRAELDSMRPAGESSISSGRQAPKRRWLSKLGLSGEEEGK